MISEGTQAPDFTLSDQDGRSITLSDELGSYVLLYFYPKDDTPGCTKQACGIRDAEPDFKSVGIKAFGISADSVASHKKFAEKYELSFPLLADEDRSVITAYGVWGKKKFMGREYEGILRTSFLIAPNGTVAKVYENVKPAEHAGEVLADVKELAA